MLALVAGPLRSGRRGSYSGGAKREHGEAQAERLLARGLAVLKLEESRLSEPPKGGWEKQLLAWWLCQHSTARRGWVSARFGMGEESRVSPELQFRAQDRITSCSFISQRHHRIDFRGATSRDIACQQGQDAK
jgi:hypothetical protein